MLPTTVDEVLEVLFKVISGLVLAKLILDAGLGKPMGSAGAILGVSIGSVISLLYMVVYKRRNYNTLSGSYTGGRAADAVPGDDERVDSAWTIVKNIISIGVPIAFGACIMALLNSIDSKLCMNRLQAAAGFLIMKQRCSTAFERKAQTLFNLPAAFITPLTIAIVPAISGAIVRGDRAEAIKTSDDSMRISAAVSLPMGVGLAVLSFPIMKVLYTNSNAAGPGLLSIMGVASIFVCIVLMENAVLQASGKEKLTMLTMITGGLVKIIINWFLVAQRPVNIYGAPVGTLVSYAVMMLMNLVFIRGALRHKPDLAGIFAAPLVSSLLMGASAWAVYGLCGKLLGTGDRLHMLVCMAAAIRRRL